MVMNRYFQMWCNFDIEYANFDLDKPIYEHFGSDVKFYGGVPLKNVFPTTTIILKSKPKPPDFLTLGSVAVVSDRLRIFLQQERVSAEFIDINVIQKGEPLEQRYYFANFLDVISCFDFDRSIFQEYPPEAGGGILNIDELYLDEEKIGNCRLFVLDECLLTLVREDLADALEQGQFTGISLKPLPEGPF